MSSPSAAALPGPAAAHTRRWHWLMLLACGLYCHGVLLTNDLVYWDGWYLRVWLISGNWAMIHEFFSAVGMPLYAWFNWMFAGLADPVPTMMFVTVACLLVSTLLIYEIAERCGWLTPEESLAVALLGTAFPVFLAAQEIIMAYFIFTHTLFLAGVLAALLSMDARGGRAMAWRGAALTGLFVAGSNAGLLVFQGASFAFLFACWRRRHPCAWWPGTVRFAVAHLDFLLLPAATWWFRHTVTPQFGTYADYNAPKFDWIGWELGFKQFLSTTMAHVGIALRWLAGEPGLLFAAGLLMAVCWWRAPARWRFQPGPASTRWLLGWSALALGLGILPYVAADKSLGLAGVESRTGLLLPVPAGLVVFALVRKALTCLPGRHGVLFWPVVALSVVALGREYTAAYLAERVAGIQSLALVELISDDPLVRRSSYVRVTGDGSLLATQVAYLTYGLGEARGLPLSSFATAQAPVSKLIVPPDQIERSLVRRSVLLPREFLHINPAGSQVDVACTIPRWPGTSAELTWLYLAAHWRGRVAEWQALRARLVQVDCKIVREEMPLVSAPTRAVLLPSATAQGDFINGTGMQLIRLKGGWWAGKFEVTQSEYEQVMGTNPSRFRDPRRPVESVSWHEAREFCRRLTAAEASAGRLPSGHVYSLPTESLWHDLAAGTLLADGIFNRDNQRWHTAPVGTLPASPQNLHDVRGNVWEWCLDWADAAKHYRLIKGECWFTERPAPSLLNASRGMRPDQAFWNTGFRCVLVPEASLPAEFAVQR
ncbi:MAG: SUMF1/EgtB/PvdO family nonheme iron enzyme [Verrucomicrobia bacterium]|nr:SUMF1/EgtB/PvdO family nonheme iron enzyme [Verrucomicrobiota bacterium]